MEVDDYLSSDCRRNSLSDLHTNKTKTHQPQLQRGSRPSLRSLCLFSAAAHSGGIYGDDGVTLNGKRHAARPLKTRLAPNVVFWPKRPFVLQTSSRQVACRHSGVSDGDCVSPRPSHGLHAPQRVFDFLLNFMRRLQAAKQVNARTHAAQNARPPRAFHRTRASFFFSPPRRSLRLTERA